MHATSTTTTRKNGSTTRKASGKAGKPTAPVIDIPATITRARLHYGCAGPKLMGKLTADGFQGATLAERVTAWGAAHPADEPTTSEPTATDTTPEPVAVADEPADVPTVEPVADEPSTDTTPDEPAAAPFPLPEPVFIPADVPAVEPGALAPIPAAPATTPTVPPVIPAAPRTPSAGSRSGGVNLMGAARQWAERPADERFWTLEDAFNATKHHKETAREVSFKWDDAGLAVSDDGNGINLVLPDGTAAALTHYATGQLCSRIKAPHQYLAKLPTDVAVACLEAGMVAEFGGKERGGNALVHQNGSTKLRSLTSDKYARFWNCEVYESLLPLTERGWRTPPARPAGVNDPRSRRAEPADCLKRSGEFWGTVKPGEWIAPSGIYASDHDMFAFLINEDMRIDDGTPDGLARGFFVSNSEVGAGALKLKAFWYRDVCSNHIVWGAEHIIDVSVRHVGTFDSIRSKFRVQVQDALNSFTSASLAGEQAVINRAREFMLSTNSDPVAARKEVLNALIAGVSGGRTLKPASGISVGMFDKAIDYAVQFADVDKVHPFSLWGAVNGLTRYSQSADVGASYADERARVDALTGKLLKLVGAADVPAIAA